MSETRKKITICQNCRRRLFKVKNPGPSGAWYHRRNASTSCRPGEGGTKALPLEIEVPR